MRGTRPDGSAGHGADEAFRPYRDLALSVLARALLDVMNPAQRGADREDARAFLAGSRMLFHWCRVAAIDPHCVMRHAATLATDRDLLVPTGGAYPIEPFSSPPRIT